MHRARHDAVDAALPLCERCDPPAPDEPSGLSAVPHPAPTRRAEVDRLVRGAFARIEAGEPYETGAALGRTVARYRGDGSNGRGPFPARGAGPPPAHARLGRRDPDADSTPRRPCVRVRGVRLAAPPPMRPSGREVGHRGHAESPSSPGDRASESLPRPVRTAGRV